LIILDSNHTHDHVRQELDLYAPFVGKGSYLVVCDTVIEIMTPGEIGDRPWAPGNSPMSAVDDFLKSNDRFEIDKEIDAKLLISVAPRGYLACIKD
jgi:cephalosporin hydroxylase